MREWIKTLYRNTRDWVQGRSLHEHTRELIGTGIAQQVAQRGQIASLRDVEFRVHSQFGDDGIIQWLVARLPSLPHRFVEFGVEDYTEANTRFLMVNNYWSGLVMDGSTANIKRLHNRRGFWRHDLTAIAQFLTRENVDGLIASWTQGRDVGLLHIDVDGNDYWLWDAVKSITPGIAIIEFNPIFGPERAITTPYAPTFRRFDAHYSGQYAGASLAALAYLGSQKGYGLIGTNSAGNNAYFVRRELLGSTMPEVSPTQAWTHPSFRNSMDTSGHLDYLPFEKRQSTLHGLPVVNVQTGETESF